MYVALFWGCHGGGWLWYLPPKLPGFPSLLLFDLGARCTIFSSFSFVEFTEYCLVSGFDDNRWTSEPVGQLRWNVAVYKICLVMLLLYTQGPLLSINIISISGNGGYVVWTGHLWNTSNAPVLGIHCSCFRFYQEGYIKIPKQHMLMPELGFVLYKLTLWPFCQGKCHIVHWL
jgi:hypothetical protein